MGFLSAAGCHQKRADSDQGDAGGIPHCQPLAKKDHRKDCHQHHAQFVERSDLSGIAKAEGAEIEAVDYARTIGLPLVAQLSRQSKMIKATQELEEEQPMRAAE